MFIMCYFELFCFSNNPFPHLTITPNSSVFKYWMVTQKLFRCPARNGASSVEWILHPWSLTCPANQTFYLKVTEDFSQDQLNLGRTQVFPKSAMRLSWHVLLVLTNTTDLVQPVILQSEYHHSQVQVEANLTKRITDSCYSIQSTQYTTKGTVCHRDASCSTFILMFNLP